MGHSKIKYYQMIDRSKFDNKLSSQMNHLVLDY